MSQLWVEKYRPSTINHILSQEEILKSLENILEKKNMPHLLFFGPSGSGKTSTVLALAKDLFKDEYKNRVIELNASDERGIKVVRDKIKVYAQLALNKKEGIPDFKIIILDEADSMTVDSQFALRKIMEEYGKITRFCIICNYHHKIIDPIISRCSLIRFKPIHTEKIKEKIREIGLKEKLKLDENTIELINELSRGDLRKGINLLQKCRYIHDDENFITTQNIYDILGIINKEKLKKLLNLAISKNEKLLKKYLQKLSNDSYSFVNQIKNLTDILLADFDLDDNIKSLLILKLIEIDQNLIIGCNEKIQFYNFFYYILSL